MFGCVALWLLLLGVSFQLERSDFSVFSVSVTVLGSCWRVSLFIWWYFFFLYFKIENPFSLLLLLLLLLLEFFTSALADCLSLEFECEQVLLLWSYFVFCVIAGHFQSGKYFLVFGLVSEIHFKVIQFNTNQFYTIRGFQVTILI